MTRPILSCTGIHKWFEYPIVPTNLLQDMLLKPGTHRKHWRLQALNDVSLTVAMGEWVGLYGPNGSGKTTLLRILGGLMQHDAGKVVCHGKLSCFFTLGVGFHLERLADENIYFHGLFHGLSGEEIAAKTEKIIRFAGVESHRHLPLKCYSQGMQMRLAYAAAAHVDADIYLLDEVLAVGDRAFQTTCEEYMFRMKREGKSVLLVAHDENVLEKYCNRIAYLENGKIVGERVIQSLIPIHGDLCSAGRHMTSQ